MRYLLATVLLWSPLSFASSESCEGNLRAKSVHALFSDITKKSLDEKVTVKLRFETQDSKFVGIWEIWKERYPIEVKRTSAVNERFTEVEVSGRGRDIARALLELDPVSLASTKWLVSSPPEKRQAILDGSDFSKVEVLKRLLLTPVYRLELNRRAKAGLLNDDVLFVGDLVSLSPARIRSISSMGETSLRRIETTLANLQLRLNMRVAVWPPEHMTSFTQKLGRHPGLSRLDVSDWDGLTIEELGNLFDSNTTGLSPEYPKRLVGRGGNKPVFALMRLDYFINTSPRELNRSMADDDKSYRRLRSEIFMRFQAWQKQLSSLAVYPASDFIDTKAKTLFRKAASSRKPFIVKPPDGLKDAAALIVLPMP